MRTFTTLPAYRAIRLTSRHAGQLALAGLLLLLLLTLALMIVRNRVENDIVQHAAVDLPLLKNRWPQFKQAVREIYPLISTSLTDQSQLSITTPLPEVLNKITTEYSQEMVGSGGYTGR